MSPILSPKSLLTDGYILDIEDGSELIAGINLEMTILVDNQMTFHGKLEAKANTTQKMLQSLELRTMTIKNKLEATYVG